MTAVHLSGKNVLVTGGSGFIGASVVRAFQRSGAEVTVADRVSFPDCGVRTVVGDLTDPSARDAAVSKDLDGIVHLAAITSVLESMKDPAGAYEANIAVTQGLLELARHRGVERFLMASTNAVAGDVGAATIHEGVPLRPLTPYGATKAAGEMMLAGYGASYGMATSALRLTNVYGPGMARKDSFVPRLVRAALSGSAVHIYGDGRQSRDLVKVDDVVHGFLLAWERMHTGPLILGSGRSVTVLELTEAVRRVTGRPLLAEHMPAKSGEMPAVIVDITRARRLGYEPTVTLEHGLATVWADFDHREPGASLVRGSVSA